MAEAFDLIKEWFNTLFSSEHWTAVLGGIVEGFKITFKNAVNGAIEIVNRFIALVNEKLNFSWQPMVIGGKTIVSGGVFQLFTVPSIPMFANGGFPEDGAFFANSGELVGKFSNGKTAVANNEQIVEAVALGVYEAMTAAMSNDSQDGNTKIVINLDGQKIYENQQKIARGKGYNLGMGAFA